jgi:hypothetical protein
MLIANPIYDSVFKYLLEDLDIAKRFLSVIIGEQIIEIELKPQEQTTPSVKHLMSVYRVDFKAVIKTETGAHKKVLIELQKGKKPIDVTRFRRYLGDNYTKTDIVNGEVTSLPIIAIYFLGFSLMLEPAVTKIVRIYTDIAKSVVIPEIDPFMEKLTHDAYFIQIPKLPIHTQNKLEHVLSIFNQHWIYNTDEKRLMNFMGIIADEDMELITKRLAIASQSEEIQRQILLEDELTASVDNIIREKDEMLLQKYKEIAKKDEEMAKKDQEMTDLKAQMASMQAMMQQILNDKK